jgi:hypothetical protein
MRAHTAAIRQQSGLKPSRHIPPNVQAVSYYRSRITASTQKLHSLTWDVAVRRGNCFSQALGIAVTSYLASLSDGGPGWRFANLWAKHGYLITFEGLLSAVGKELGMIEDASTAVEMLRMVSVVLVSDDSNNNDGSAGSTSRQRIPVPFSPFVKWVYLIYLTPNGSGSKTQYRLDVGLDPSYYQNRVPAPLKGGAAVRFFPVLFQMGVDIRQWGANTGRSVTTQIKDRAKGGNILSESTSKDAEDVETNGEFGVDLINDGDEEDDDDEAGGVPDNEILVQLNLEAIRKLNLYAHAINPAGAQSPLPTYDQSQAQPLPMHPYLVSLGDTIKSSAGKMDHGILDKAGTVVQRLGGGSTVFCKSGKDRTGMSCTVSLDYLVTDSTIERTLSHLTRNVIFILPLVQAGSIHATVYEERGKCNLGRYSRRRRRRVFDINTKSYPRHESSYLREKCRGKQVCLQRLASEVHATRSRPPFDHTCIPVEEA